MQSEQIRRTFLDFFVEKGHRLVPSSSLIPNDPTLLLTGAGMVPFKPFFVGEATPPTPRATSVQKCARTVDIENVGHTSRHVTFFEMLGNFSFGDYFKAGAIDLAWELCTERYGLDPERLWATVYLDDDEAVEHWLRVGVPAERIQRLGKDDNFWSMGVPGPCGPCSEVYYDRGEAYGREGGPAVDPERYLEFWNLVFMQNIRDADYNIVGELPRKNIDTGLGFERLAIILQDVPTMFDVDVLAPILDRVQELTGRPYRASDADDISLRIVTDHVRTSTFLIADGVLPSNEGRGYVLRRLLRRAVRHVRLLGYDDVALPAVATGVVETLGGPWPELVEHQTAISQVLASEEESFSRTLRQGSVLLDSAIGEARQRGQARLPGEAAFRLHDTYGFPVELTMEAAAEVGLEVDTGRFTELMDEQRARALEARRQLSGSARRAEALRDLVARHGTTTSVAYETTSAEAQVIGLLSSDGDELPAAEEGSKIELLLDRTPFYAEGGGQVGDTGLVRTPGGAEIEITDTRPGPGGLVVHTATVLGGEVREGGPVLAEVDAVRRAAVARSHTATHVLHWALRDQLGPHANQHGSLVDAGRLRFDFSHFSAVPPEQLEAVQWSVNQHLADDPGVRTWYATQEEARAAGAIALFGEKYGDRVRVVDIGDFSRELCGGTHVGHGTQVGPVKILGESSIGSSLRRIEALTGVESLAYYEREHRLLAEVAALLRVPPDEAPDRLRNALATLKTAETELARLRASRLDEVAAELATGAAENDGVWVVVERVEATGVDELRRVATSIRDRRGGTGGAVVLGAAADGKAALVALVTPDLLERGVAARDLITEAARAVGGGGGGRGDLATGSGREPAKLGEALATARADLHRLLGEHPA